MAKIFLWLFWAALCVSTGIAVLISWVLCLVLVLNVLEIHSIFDQYSVFGRVFGGASNAVIVQVLLVLWISTQFLKIVAEDIRKNLLTTPASESL